MGTNYYAYVIPSEEQKKSFCKAVMENQWDVIDDLYEKLYGELRYKDGKFVGGKIHIGKKSFGWRFVVDPNFKRCPDDPNGLLTMYELSKKGIHDLIYRPDIVIYDEYGNKTDKDELWNMIIDTRGKVYDNDMTPYSSEYTELLEAWGFQLGDNKADMIIDGIRFATFTDFS